MSGLPKIREIDHVVLRVRDLERALHFYVEILGCVEERRVEGIGLVQLRAGRSLVDLVPVESVLGRARGDPPDPKAPNLDHVAFRLDPFDEPALRAHLARNGVEAGALERRYGAEGYGPSIYLHDPDGNLVELRGPGER